MTMELVFDGWSSLGRTLLLTVLAYPCLLLILRVSGHRTLAKLNAFDLIITVALGSTLASMITSSTVSLAQGILAFSLLTGLQYLVAKATVWSRRAESLVNGEPVLLFHDGRFLRDAMNRARITDDEIKAKARSKGQADLSQVVAVVLETNGHLSVIRRDSGRADDTLQPVPNYRPESLRRAHEERSPH